MLTRSLPAYKYIVLENHPKIKQFSSVLATTYSSADCTRVLFKNSASLRVYNEKKIRFFFFFLVSDIIKYGRFLAILAHVTWPRAQPLDGSILLFSLEIG